MATRHEFQFRFDVPFLRAALRRDVLWRGYVMGGIVVALVPGMRLWLGYWHPWLSGFLLAAAAVSVWRFHAMLGRAAGRVFELWSKQSPGGVIRYELDDEGFSVVLENSRSRFSWNGLRRLWRYDDVWILEIVKMQSVFFPPGPVPGEVRDYIVERCRSAGVRV